MTLPHLVAPGLGKQPLEFAHRQRVRERLALLRRPQWQRRVADDSLLLDEETNDSVTSLALVAQGQAVTLLPRLVRPEDHPRFAVRAIAEGSVHRTIFTATRTADAKRPSVQALLAAVRAAAASLCWPAPGG
ncbi:MAG: LysR substrate-binding domain-containing protein [Gaiellaceae bacterium]